MDILADQCVNKDVIVALKREGFNIITVFDVKLGGADDETIFNYAVNNNRVLLTFDKDFGNILRFNINNSPGVAIIYVENLTKDEIIANALGFFAKFNSSQMKGKLFIIEKSKLRIWRR